MHYKAIFQTEQHKNVPSLGYILGDEGSGAYFGKQLLKDFLYLNLPPEIDDFLKNERFIKKDIILKKLYSEPNPNRYLASFGPVLIHFFKSIFFVLKITKPFQLVLLVLLPLISEQN